MLEDIIDGILRDTPVGKRVGGPEVDCCHGIYLVYSFDISVGEELVINTLGEFDNFPNRKQKQYLRR